MVKNLLASAGDVRDKGLIPGWGGSPGGGHGNPLQYSCPENPIDAGACHAAGSEESGMTERLKNNYHL